MALTEGNFDWSVVVHLVLTLALGVTGLGCNGLMVSYYSRKEKLDQLSIIYGSLAGFSLPVSALMLFNFIFFFVDDLYYPYAHVTECQGNFSVFVSAAFRVLYMALYRTLVYLLVSLIFLTACKVKWPIFKIRTQHLKHLIAFYPVVLFLVMCIHSFITVSCSTPFYIPWIGTGTVMTIIYFWILLILPGILALACLIFLLQVISCDPQTSPAEEKGAAKNPTLRITLDTIKEEAENVAGAGKIKTSLSQVKTKLSNSKTNIRTKFEGREVTKKTILTTLLTTSSLLTTLVISNVTPLRSIYSDNDILQYDIHHTVADFNNLYVCSVLVPVFLLTIVNPVILMFRVGGLRRFTGMVWGRVCGCCLEGRRSVVDI